MKIKLLCILLIFIIGCHIEATYTMRGTVESVNGNEVFFIDETDNLFSCKTKESFPSLNEGDEYVLKFRNNGTESNRLDDGLIDFGKHSFLWFVW